MSSTMTICFSGTDCEIDQGLVERFPDEKEQYNKTSGYIPAKIHRLLSDWNEPTIVVPGCGGPYDRLRTRLNLVVWTENITEESLEYPSFGPIIRDFSYSKAPEIIGDSLTGHSISYLACHALSELVGATTQLIDGDFSNRDVDALKDAINLDDLDKANKTIDGIEIDGLPKVCWLKRDKAQLEKVKEWKTVNLIGHSRGGVVAIVTANLIARYFPHIKVNVIGLDPVPGTGSWPAYQCTLSQKVNSYRGIYAIDETSGGFNAVVPGVQLSDKKRWDPLAKVEKTGHLSGDYSLIFSRGRHATIPGSRVADGTGDFTKVDDRVGAVGNLIFHFCIKQLQFLGVAVKQQGTTEDEINQLKRTILSNSKLFYTMRNTHYLPSGLNGGPFEKSARGVSSTPGWSPTAWDYLEKFIPASSTAEQGNSKAIKQTTSPHEDWHALTDLDTDNHFVYKRNQGEANGGNKGLDRKNLF